MLKGIKVQIYPTTKQEKYLSSLFGTARFIYNKSLEYKIYEYTINKKSVGLKELGKHFTYELRDKNEWVKEHNTKVLKQSILNMLESYKRFFINHNGFPKFKKKHDIQSIRFPVDAISKHTFSGNKVNFIKEFKNVKFKCSNKYYDILHANNGKVRSATVFKNKAGKYFCSFLVEAEHAILPKTEKIIGLDLGINSFLVTSENTEITNPRFYRRNEEKLKTLQRRLSRKKKGSKNRNKARLKVAKLFYKISNHKYDFLHKLSTELVKENKTIIIEDLFVKGLLERTYLSKSIQELSLYEFTRHLCYKSEWNGRLLVKVDRYFPSSQICFNCGNRKSDLKLSDRMYNCDICKQSISRDYNAALNIKAEGLRLIGSRPAEFKPVEIEKSKKQESNINL